MDPLQELCARLKTQAATGMGMKAYFYAERSGERMRHGRIFLYRDGNCVIEFEDLDPSAALLALRDLALTRLVTLLDATLVHAAPGAASLRVETVLARISGSSVPVGTGPVAAAAPSPPGARIPVVHLEVTTPAGAHGLPPVIQLVDRTRALLEEYFGGGAGRRLQDIAQRFPPGEQPAAFLVSAETLLGSMVGARKAAEAFDRLRVEWGI